MSIEFLNCLKGERDISIKSMLSGGKWHSGGPRIKSLRNWIGLAVRNITKAGHFK